MRAAVAAAFVAALALSAPAAGESAQRETVAGGLDAAGIARLVESIENPESRARLVQRLRALQAAAGDPPPPPGPVESLSRRLGRSVTDIAAGAAVILDPEAVAAWFRAHGRAAVPAAFAFLWKLALALAAGGLCEAGVRRLLAGPRAAAESRHRPTPWTRLPYLLVRTLLDIAPIAVFAVAGYVVLAAIEPADVTRVAAAAAINAVAGSRLLIAAARAALAPRAPNLRVIGLGDESAAYLTVWVRRFANLGVYGYFLADAALQLGLSAPLHATLTRLIGLVFALLAMVFVAQNRQAVSARISGDGAPAGLRQLRRLLADTWHVLVIGYLGVVYVVWALGVQGAFVLRATAISVVVAVAAGLLAMTVRRALHHAFGVRRDLIARYPGLAARANRYFAVLHGATTGVFAAAALFATLEAWGVDAFSWIATDIGYRAVTGAVSIVIAVVLGILFWELASALIERQLAGERAPGARARTLLPLLRKILLIVIVSVVGLVVLSELGLNIAPLLAGAGVVGVAVGFGSQALVRDVITGFFILAEDQFGIGDVISVDGAAGTVEDISVRTIRLRDLSGNMHVIPFSSVSTVTNMTRDYSRCVFDIGVGYREDVDEVIEVLRVLGEELGADDTLGPAIREPLEIMGLNELADSAVVIRARITTDPGSQWAVGREFRRRVKRRFDELGIEIPYPHQTIYFGEDKDGRAPAAAVRIEGAGA